MFCRFRATSYVALVSLLLLSCKYETPTQIQVNQIKVVVNTTIVPSKTAGVLGGPGFYYRLVIWDGRFNPLWGDTALQNLLDSNFKVVEYWYPQDPSVCIDPFKHEREIARLDYPDTSIIRLGYAPLSKWLPDTCIIYLRHYVVSRVIAGG